MYKYHFWAEKGNISEKETSNYRKPQKRAAEQW